MVIFFMLIVSVIGVCLFLFMCLILVFNFDSNLFVIVKCFVVGIILVIGFMYVLLDFFNMLLFSCLKENLWYKFFFMGFVVMLFVMVILMVDFMVMLMYIKKCNNGVILEVVLFVGGV